ncbi:hypothetical protein ACFONJ_02330 [Chryseobacterium tructae]|uniref:Lipoprotein n=2 Tax=Chryseobacterium tructae TaxID=1037380 RepID=A0ABV7XP64_9FLAO
METIFQKYRDIKTKYETLVEKNKQNLIYEDGVYYNQTLFDKEKKKEKWIEPLQSESKLILKEGDKEFFVKDERQSVEIYTTVGGNLIEQASLIKKDNKVSMVINLAEGIDAKYDYNNNKIYITHFIEDKYDPKKQDIMLYQEFINDKLILEKNYKEDFKISKEQMLKDLPDNFYTTALNYRIKKQKEDFEKNQMKVSVSEIEKSAKEKIQFVKEKLKTALETKNDFYRKIRVYKIYNENSIPVYSLIFPENPGVTRIYWMISINAETNKIISIEEVNPRD